MKRKIILIRIVCLGLLLGLTTLVILTYSNGSRKFTVSFVNAETCTGPFPNFEMMERQAFAFRNAGSNSGFVEVTEVESEHGNWIPSRYMLGEAEAGRTTQLYLYLPRGSHPRIVRMRVLEDASAVQKIRFALRLLIEKALGRYPGKRVWFDRLRVPAYEFTVKLDQAAELEAAVNGSPPIHPETNRTSSTTNSRHQTSP
jgi:hypothetical protein